MVDILRKVSRARHDDIASRYAIGPTPPTTSQNIRYLHQYNATEKINLTLQTICVIIHNVY